jgi:hypothetical protein
LNLKTDDYLIKIVMFVNLVSLLFNKESLSGLPFLSKRCRRFASGGQLIHYFFG